MSNLPLAAIKREKSSKGNLGRIRKEGNVPAIVYGLDKEPELVTIKAVDLRPHLTQRNHIIDLQVAGAGQKVMLKMIERDPIRKDLIHIDFLRVNDVNPVVVNVPVTTHGMPYGVKTEGGVFSTMKKFVKLRAKIKDIPEKYDIDVSDLKSGVIYYARDLKLANGVTLVTPGKTALFGVTTGRAEEETPVAAPAAAAAPAAGAAAPAADAGKKDDKKK